MRMLRSYSLLLERGRRRLRSLRMAMGLRCRVNRLAAAAPDAVMLFATVRNEMDGLPRYLEYYRKLGIGHFVFVDNASTDGTTGYVASQPDCSLWIATGSYRAAGYGMDWLNYLLNRHARNRWVLVADADEFLVYPHCDSRNLSALTSWLASRGVDSMATMQVDVYPDRSDTPVPGNASDLLGEPVCFDAANYTYFVNARYDNLWIQGGPRQRAFFSDAPELAPALNKTALIRWKRGCVFVSSTHIVLPRRLNRTYARDGSETLCGCLVHTKLLGDLRLRAAEEIGRGEHFDSAAEYRAYLRQDTGPDQIWSRFSTPYTGWRALEQAGLISTGNWT